MIELEFPFSTILKERFGTGKLMREWAKRYPQIFDEVDVKISVNQPTRHFFEWLGAVLLYESTGYLSLIEKFTSKPHERKTQIFRKIVPSRVYECVLHSSTKGSGGDPDLFVYSPDHSDWFFCETKGPTDRFRANQIKCCAELERVCKREIHILSFRSID